MVVILAGYAWVMTGVHPFTSLSYVLVAVPSVAFVVAYACWAAFHAAALMSTRTIGVNPTVPRFEPSRRGSHC